MKGKALHLLLCLLFVLRCSAETLSDGKDVDAFVSEQISSADVVVFAKSYCGFCRHTRTLLKGLHEKSKNKWSLKVLDIDHMGEDGPLVQMELLTKTGQRTVPNIFIHGEHVGGDSDLSNMYSSGQLKNAIYGLRVA